MTWIELLIGMRGRSIPRKSLTSGCSARRSPAVAAKPLVPTKGFWATASVTTFGRGETVDADQQFLEALQAGEGLLAWRKPSSQ